MASLNHLYRMHVQRGRNGQTGRCADGRDISGWITSLLGGAKVMSAHLGSCAPYMILESSGHHLNANLPPVGIDLQRERQQEAPILGQSSCSIIQKGQLDIQGGSSVYRADNGEICRNSNLFTAVGEFRFRAPALVGCVCILPLLLDKK